MKSVSTWLLLLALLTAVVHYAIVYDAVLLVPHLILMFISLIVPFALMAGSVFALRRKLTTWPIVLITCVVSLMIILSYGLNHWLIVDN